MRTYCTNIYHKNLLLQNINVLLIKLGFPHKVLKAHFKKGLSFKAICFCFFLFLEEGGLVPHLFLNG